jgi:hypothetical protein
MEKKPQGAANLRDDEILLLKMDNFGFSSG